MNEQLTKQLTKLAIPVTGHGLIHEGSTVASAAYGRANGANTWM
ncbi:MAG: hypothetical protein ACRC6S_09975 [Shewanella sp.]